MNVSDATEVLVSDELGCHASEITIAQLVGKVYETAPPVERSRLLEHLLQPIGVLGLAAVANGMFAKIRFRGGWPKLQVRIEDVRNVQASDVIKLVEYVQHVSVQTVDGLAQILGMMPTMASSAAAALLVTVLARRARTRRAEDN
jgi:hypothetical protein